MQIVASGALLDPYMLTIGFARRFATYKRGSLVLRDVDRLLRIVRMRGALVDLEVGHLLAAERTARNHALHGLLDHTLRILAVQDLALGTALDPARVTGVPVEDVGVALVAGQLHLLGIDHDDMVAAIHVRGVGRLVLATQDVRQDAGEPAENEAVGVDDVPLLLDFGRLQIEGLHRHTRFFEYGSAGRRYRGAEADGFLRVKAGLCQRKNFRFLSTGCASGN